MTQRSEFSLTCDCGHQGALLMSENDQPYSKCWESYSLRDFNGGTHHVEGFATMEEVFAEIKATCPACGRVLTPTNLR